MFGIFALCGLLFLEQMPVMVFYLSNSLCHNDTAPSFLAYAFGVLFYDRAKVRKIYLLNRCYL